MTKYPHYFRYAYSPIKPKRKQQTTSILDAMFLRKIHTTCFWNLNALL